MKIIQKIITVFIGMLAVSCEKDHDNELVADTQTTTETQLASPYGHQASFKTGGAAYSDADLLHMIDVLESDLSDQTNQDIDYELGVLLLEAMLNRQHRTGQHGATVSIHETDIVLSLNNGMLEAQPCRSLMAQLQGECSTATQSGAFISLIDLETLDPSTKPTTYAKLHIRIVLAVPYDPADVLCNSSSEFPFNAFFLSGAGWGTPYSCNTSPSWLGANLAINTALNEYVQGGHCGVPLDQNVNAPCNTIFAVHIATWTKAQLVNNDPSAPLTAPFVTLSSPHVNGTILHQCIAATRVQYHIDRIWDFSVTNSPVNTNPIWFNMWLPGWNGSPDPVVYHLDVHYGRCLEALPQ